MNSTTNEPTRGDAYRVQILRAQLEAAHDAVERLIVERDAALERIRELEMDGACDVTDLLEDA